MSIAKNFKEIRLNRGLSQKELAAKMNITRSMIVQIERGTRTPNLLLGKELAKVLQCDINDFLDKDEQYNEKVTAVHEES